MNDWQKDYEKFESVLNSEKFRREYEQADFGQEIVSFQMYGFSTEQIEEFLERYDGKYAGELEAASAAVFMREIDRKDMDEVFEYANGWIGKRDDDWYDESYQVGGLGDLLVYIAENNECLSSGLMNYLNTVSI